MSKPTFYRALPAYLGGKRRLTPYILSLLADVLPRERWGESVLLDPFCGGCSFALTAKAYGFQVIAGDIAERAVLVARALVTNSSRRLTRQDVEGLEIPLHNEDRGIAASHSPDVFTAEQAVWLDGALANAMTRTEPARSLLLLLIMKLALRCQPMSMLRGTDARAAGDGDFDLVSPRRLAHYLKARDLFTASSVWVVAEEVNAGVFGGRGRAIKGDAISVLTAEPADVVYLDPPYADTTSYSREYRVLDEMLGEVPDAGEVPGLEEIIQAAVNIPYLILSYGGPTATLSGLENMLGKQRPVLKAVAVPYTHLRSISRRPEHERFEYIIIAGTG